MAIPSAIESQALKAAVSESNHRNNDLSQARKRLKHEEKHLTDYNNKILLMAPTHDVIELQYTKAKYELLAAYLARKAEFDGVVLQQAKSIENVTEIRQDVKRRKVATDGASSTKRHAIQ